jgi:hypothetical protein
MTATWADTLQVPPDVAVAAAEARATAERQIEDMPRVPGEVPPGLHLLMPKGVEAWQMRSAWLAWDMAAGHRDWLASEPGEEEAFQRAAQRADDAMQALLTLRPMTRKAADYIAAAIKVGGGTVSSEAWPASAECSWECQRDLDRDLDDDASGGDR